VTYIGVALVAMLFIVAVFIIANTVRITMYNRRLEISIMKAVGATNSFIRTPFFVEGMVTGFFAGAGAFFITWAVYRAVYRILTEQAMLMNAFGIGSIIPFGRIRLYVGLAYLLAGCIIGALGSVISTRKHLDV
jgi:cell division transport system permease protein